MSEDYRQQLIQEAQAKFQKEQLVAEAQAKWERENAPEDDGPGVVMGTLGAAGKALDVARGAITAPMLAAFLENQTGKDVYKMKENFDAINPTNLNQFPSSDELLKRAGVPQGGKLSDIVPGYAEPGEGGWFQPEKGGMLDFSARGTGGTATDIGIDPLTYLSMGSSAAAKKALQKLASTRALQKAPGVVGKTIDTLSAPIKAAGDRLAPLVDFAPAESDGILKKIAKATGRGATTVATTPSRMVKSAGKGMYGSPLQQIEHEGKKFNKSEISETLYRAGISSMGKLRNKAGDATERLVGARDRLLQQADKAGAKVDLNDSFAAAQTKIKELRGVGTRDADALADSLESELNDQIVRAQGTPATAPTKKVVDTGILGPDGRPVLKEQVIPGQPATPGKPVTPSMATKKKSFYYQNIPQSGFNQNLNTPASAAVKKSLSEGLKEGTEDAVAKVLGPQAGADIAELNAEAGKLLSTRKAIMAAENKFDRVANNTASLTGTDTILGAGATAVKGEVSGGLTAMALKKFMDTMRLGTMPLGYGMRKAGESQLTGPALDIFLRKSLTDSTKKEPKDGKED